MTVKERYEAAKERYEKLGVDVDKALDELSKISLSMHCWQGDDVVGFDQKGPLSGGIQTTGNYPYRARTTEELMQDIDEVFRFLTSQGQSPRIFSDSYITLELMGHRLDREVERLYEEAKGKQLEGTDITSYIDNHVCMANVLRTTMSHYDGGYVMCGLTGSGEMFAVRDPWGIRPLFYYIDEEIVAMASERPVLQTTFNLHTEDVQELQPGKSLIVRRNGESMLEQILPAQKLSACSFERIYFSRGSDRDIYQERKRLGEQLMQPIMKAIDGDIGNTVFSYIPNTAEVAFYGMTDGFRQQGHNVRTEKVVWKDIKLRTFIADNTERNDLSSLMIPLFGVLPFGRASSRFSTVFIRRRS